MQGTSEFMQNILLLFLDYYSNMRSVYAFVVRMNLYSIIHYGGIIQ